MNGFARHFVLLLNGGRRFPHCPGGAAPIGSSRRVAKAAPRRRQFLGHHRQEAGSAPNHLQQPWPRIRRRAGLEDGRIHDLRPLFASRALALGESLTMIGNLLGHSDIETTARYGKRRALGVALLKGHPKSFGGTGRRQLIRGASVTASPIATPMGIVLLQRFGCWRQRPRWQNKHKQDLGRADLSARGRSGSRRPQRSCRRARSQARRPRPRWGSGP